MSTIDLCPTCLRPATLRKASEIDIQSRQAEADRINAFADSLEAAVCDAIGVDPVAVRLAALEAENKGLAARVAELEEALENIINAGKPNQRDHPSMWKAWLKARLVMKAKEAKP